MEKAKRTDEKSVGSETIKVLDRALDILQILTVNPEGRTLRELSSDLQLPPVTMRRFIQNLVKVDFVSLDPKTDRYRLGLSLLTIASTLRQNVNVSTKAQPILEWLRDRTNETAGVRVRFDNFAIVVANADANHPLRYVRAIGQGIPLHAGASGKLLLAALSPEELDRFFNTAELTRLAENTIVSEQELREEVERTRRLGYAISIGEVSREGSSLAVPVYDMTNRVVATIGIVAPMTRVTVSKLMDLVDIVSEAGLELSRQLGYRGTSLSPRDQGASPAFYID